MTGHRMEDEKASGSCLRAVRIGVVTLQESHIYLRRDSTVCRAEGFSAHNRVLVTHGEHSLVATLYQVTSDFLKGEEAGVSEFAWDRLGLTEGAEITIQHAPPVESLSEVRAKVYGHRLGKSGFAPVISDIERGRYSNIQLAAFITACASRALDYDEMRALTEAMVNAGERLTWDRAPIADKHSVGGLPGNRTTPIVVAIAAACGLTIPKTSSRAITSPAGTADAMEVLAPVDLDVASMRRVVEREGGCIVWGGAVRLSPTDDILIRIERVLELDAEGQLVASILSKKIAAGATHLVLDLPVGPSAKIRSREAAQSLSEALLRVAESFGLTARTILTDGSQPVGRGIGPALEARDVLAVLKGEPNAPADLREHALSLAGSLLELAGKTVPGTGMTLAQNTLDDGRAWRKFERICEAQGGLREPPRAARTRTVSADRAGILERIDNRRLARVAKLAGAPEMKAAGVVVEARLGERIARGQPLYTIHAESSGDLDYALSYARANDDIMAVVAS